MAEDFGKKVEQFGQDIWKKTTDVFNVLSKNTEIAGKQRELRLAYAEIGKLYCEKHGSESGSEFPEQCERALAMKKEIEELEQEVLQHCGRRKCTKCGELIDSAVAFCPHCGAAQPKEEPVEDPVEEAEVINSWICPVCGAKMDEDVQFCTVCGAKRP
ncbi:MAG: zinc ribbon domain-containing protein [Clostridiaceae bacterium]